MLFETTFRIFLGEKAYHIEDQAQHEPSRKKWFLTVFKKLHKQIDELETSTRHKETLLSTTESLLAEIKNRKFSDKSLSLLLLRLVGNLLGYTSVKGARMYTPFYHQSYEQHYTEKILKGGDPLQDHYEKKNVIKRRKELIQQLKEEGMTDFEISLVLNTTEYQIIKLRKNF